jgi:hypothetical protein
VLSAFLSSLKNSWSLVATQSAYSVCLSILTNQSQHTKRKRRPDLSSKRGNSRQAVWSLGWDHGRCQGKGRAGETPWPRPDGPSIFFVDKCQCILVLRSRCTRRHATHVKSIVHQSVQFNHYKPHGSTSFWNYRWACVVDQGFYQLGAWHDLMAP